MVFADHSWVLIRISGTEPVARIYAESTDEQIADALIQAAKGIISQ